MKIKTLQINKIIPYERNPRKNDAAVDAVAESIRQCGYCAPIVIDEAGVILAGHTRYKALQKLGWDKAQVCVAEGLSEEQKRKYRILDNKTGEIAEWDTDLLEIELDGIDFEGFDFGLLEHTAQHNTDETVSVQGYERRKSAGEDEEAREAAMAEGLDEESPEYQAFVDKFKPKKTTDDCYTPEPVYDAIADWVAEHYGIDKARFVRPFWPGGDYQSFEYAPDAIVVDNPPFSILAQITAWYAEKDVRFFLFAPAMTLFSSSSSSCAAIPCGVSITYENGAVVNTSFLTNLEPENVRVHTLPELYQTVKAANDANLAEQRRELPKYVYPNEVLTAAAASRVCKYGQELVLTKAETERIGALDAQKESGASIFGNGYLLSSRAAAERAAAERAAAERAAAERAAAERAAAERAAAERAAAERAAAEHWQLSDRERKIIARMDQAVLNE